MSGLQQLSCPISANSTDSRFTNVEETLNEITNMVKNHQINAIYDPNNPKMKQDFTRFCTFCKKTGRTKKFSWSYKNRELHEGKAPPQRKKKFFSNLLEPTKIAKNLQIELE